MTTDSTPSSLRATASGLLVISFWFGMVTGALEAAVLWGFQFVLAPWQTLARRLVVVDANIFWASPVLDAAAFFLLGCVLILAARLLPRLHWYALATGMSAGIGSYMVLASTGYMRELGTVPLAIGLGVVFSRWMRRDPSARLQFLRKTLKPLAVATLGMILASAAGYRVREWLWMKQLPPAPPNAPSVLLIVLDTLRADRVGAYGYPRPTTPFLDSLASESVVFDHAFANSSWTLPSHASLFTGRLPYEHEATNTLVIYDGRFRTLAQELSSRGYATAGFVSNTYYGTPAHGMAHGFQRYENLFTGPWDIFRRTLIGRKFEQARGEFGEKYGRMHAPEITQRFLRWVEQQPRRPFFAFLNFMDHHSPLAPPPELVQKFAAMPEPPNPAAVDFAKLTPRLQARMGVVKNEYDAALAYVDEELRRMFDELRARGLDRNLLVIITSDHGESFGEHGIIEHRNSLYLEQVRVPLILRMPEKLPAGRRASGAVGLEAIPATVMSLAALDGHPFPGTPVTACLTEGACENNRVIAELDGAGTEDVAPGDPIAQGWVRSILTSRWHFILQQDGKVELYDWSVDPAETNNLVADPNWQKLVSEFLRELRSLPTR